MSNPSSRARIIVPTIEEDVALLAAAEDDPDAAPLSDAQLAAMVPLGTLRGRPRSKSRKLLVSVRFSPEVVAWFRSTGEGWQSRMDNVLREYVARH